MNNKSFQILGIPGSLRKQSFNRTLLQVAQTVAPDDIQVNIFDLHNIPFFNQDVEAVGTPKSVLQFREQIKTADALLISTPEYNASIPGVLKNALDWASRSGPDKTSPLHHKKIGIMGTGGGFGTMRAQLHLRQSLENCSVYLLPHPTLGLPNAWGLFNAENQLKDEAIQARISKYLLALRNWTIQLNK